MFNPFRKNPDAAREAMLPRLGVTSATVGELPVINGLGVMELLEVTEGLISDAIENKDALSLPWSGKTVSMLGESSLSTSILPPPDSMASSILSVSSSLVRPEGVWFLDCFSFNRSVFRHLARRF